MDQQGKHPEPTSCIRHAATAFARAFMASADGAIVQDGEWSKPSNKELVPDDVI